MKTTDFIKENFVADAAEAHQDHEVQMARSDCYNAAKYAIELHKLLKNISEQQGLDGWVSEKITLANDYLRTVTEYLRYEQQSGSSSDMPEFNIGTATQTLDSVLGESAASELKEGAFTWYLKAHGRLLSPLTSEEPYKFKSKEEAVAFAKEKYKTNWQNIVPTTYDVPNVLSNQPDPGWDEKKLKPVQEEDDEESQQKRKPVVIKTNKEIGSRVADIGPGGKEYNVKTDQAWDEQHKEVDEGKADPTGSWVVYGGGKVKRFKSRDGAKAYAAKTGGKVASSEFYADNIQGKQGVAEDSENKVSYNGRVIGHIATDLDGDPMGVVYDGDNRPYELYGYNDLDELKNAMMHVYTDRVQKGVAEGLGKSIKRAAQGWGGSQDKPADIVKRNKAHDTDTAKRLRAGMDDADEHTPQGLQKRVLDRKLKGVAETAGGMGTGSVATSMGGGNGFANGGPGTIARPKMKKKK